MPTDTINTFTMPTYAATGIIYARATESNLAVAATASGGRDEDITERIDPPTLATGKITATTASPTVTGVNTNFLSDFEDGEYLFAYGTGAVPFLVGKIESRDSDTQITLAGNASSDADDAPCGKMRELIKNNESILIRIPRIPLNERQSYIPNWASMRGQPFTAQSYNNQNLYTNITQYSASGTPTVIGGGTNVPFLIKPLNIFKTYTANNTIFCWQSTSEFPNFLFALYNPFGDNGQQNLNPSTMYKVFTSELINGVLITSNFQTLDLFDAGYSVPRVITPTTTAGGTQTNNPTSNN